MPGDGTIENLPFSLRELRCFIAVAEEGQMTSAAARLRSAQPAISQMLTRLELRVGTPLIERHARGATPTDAGRVFLGKARAVIAAAEEAICAVGPWARGEQRLLLGFPAGAQPLARPLRREFAARNPGVSVEAVELRAGERLKRLRAGRIDAELTYPPPSEPGLRALRVLSSPRYAVLSERHDLAGAESLSLEQVAGDLLALAPAEAATKLAERGWVVGRTGPRPRAERAPGLDELWAGICSGRAAAVLPRFMLSATVGDGVRAVRLADVAPLEVVLVRRAGDERVTVAELLAAAEANAAAAARQEYALAS